MNILITIISCMIGVAGGLLIGEYAYTFLNKPSEEVLTKLTEWLFYAVAEAEKELGGGTGQLKLRYVYDKALSKFPGIIKYISFTKFSSLVDVALAKFKESLKTNGSLQDYINHTTL